MNTDPTEVQGGLERQQAIERSLQRGHPPTQVPGYDPERLLGVERNTGRRVAIKFYAHRGGLDWSLLAREVEKLAFLFADRYVVQLLGVGWDADPPYYIMEYLENGSLADRIAKGPLRPKEAVALLRDVATGLLHAHGKGVLHCDLKPANVLLDQDGKPRLADFGQSRLTHEQAPALGTMFYMAPEQADMDAVPDARWDVYALGALLYCMLTGSPPYRTGNTIDQFERTPDLTNRLTFYRQMIEESPAPMEHHKTPGVDKYLASIVDRCLAIDPAERFPTVQSVLNALDERASRLARRPMLIVGAVGPLLLLAVVTWFAWQGFHNALQESDAALTRRALKANEFAAQFAARNAAYELDRRFRVIEQTAESERFRKTLTQVLAKPEFIEILKELSDPKRGKADLEPLREQFRKNPDRQALQEAFVAAIPLWAKPSKKDNDEVASWFFCDATGVSTLRVPEGPTLGRNYAWRSYFYGGPSDMEEAWRPSAWKHIRATTISDVFRSRSTSSWTVAISTPVFDDSPDKKFLGIIAMTFEVGQFVPFPNDSASQFAVLIDNRVGPHKGVILQHPLLDKIMEARPDKGVLDRFPDCRIAAEQLPDTPERRANYRDPLADDPEGEFYNQRWLAEMEPVRVRNQNTGWIVIIQESYQSAIGATLQKLTHGLIRSGVVALVLIALVMGGLWALARYQGNRISGGS
jgi:hypothetical protein